MPSPRRALTAACLIALASTAAACTDDEGAPTMTTTDQRPTTPPETSADADRTPSTLDLAVNGTTLHVHRRGHGDPLLLVHGGGEDASMLAAQADGLAAAGYQVITYDRRGTGASGREEWPGSGAAQHADDAAALLHELGTAPATVVGVSSGGVIALDLAARHPEAVSRVVAWEPPAAGIVPGGDAATAAIMAPVEAHLAAHPGDFVGAQAILLSAVVGFPVTADDPAFATARANAEPFVRDEPTITLADLDLEALAAQQVTIAVGSAPNDLVSAAVDVLTAAVGPAVTADADHEVYLSDPSVLTGIVRRSAAPVGEG
jgi:pimeloyl-ACP methyl ester carboxylesterase